MKSISTDNMVLYFDFHMKDNQPHIYCELFNKNGFDNGFIAKGDTPYKRNMKILKNSDEIIHKEFLKFMRKEKLKEINKK